MKFELSQEQTEKYLEFCRQQETDNYKYTGAIGGRFTISFTMTSIGQIITVKDNVTKNELDLTDYENF